MRMKLNLSGLLEEIDQGLNGLPSIPYLIKLYLKEKLNIPVIIDPLNPFDTSIEVESGSITHSYEIDETRFELHVEYHPEESLL